MRYRVVIERKRTLNCAKRISYHKRCNCGRSIQFNEFLGLERFFVPILLRRPVCCVDAFYRKAGCV